MVLDCDILNREFSWLDKNIQAGLAKVLSCFYEARRILDIMISRIKCCYQGYFDLHRLFFSARRESALWASRANALGPLNAGEAWVQTKLAVDGLRYNNTNIICM